MGGVGPSMIVLSVGNRAAESSLSYDGRDESDGKKSRKRPGRL